MDFKFKIITIILFTLFSITPYTYSNIIEKPTSETFFTDHFKLTLENARENTSKILKELENEIKSFREAKKIKSSYFNNINIHKNFLLVSDINVSVLEKGISEIEIMISSIKTKYSKALEKKKKNSREIGSVTKKITFTSKLIKETKKENGLSDELKEYDSILNNQLNKLYETEKIIKNEIQIYEPILANLKNLNLIFKKDAKEKKRNILQKNEFFFRLFSIESLKRDFLDSIQTIISYFSPTNFKNKKDLLKEHIDSAHFVIFFLYLTLFIFLKSLKSYFKKINKFIAFKKEISGYPLYILERSLLLILSVVFLEILLKTKIYIVFPDALKFLKSYLIIFLLTGIASDSLKKILKLKFPKYSDFLLTWRNTLIQGIRLYSAVYLILYNFSSLGNNILLILSIAFQIFLTISVFIFWKILKSTCKNNESFLIKSIRWCSKIIPITGLLAEIAGYSMFAGWWFVSWGVSIVVFSFLLVLYYSVKELEFNSKNHIESEKKERTAPLYWMFFKGIYFLIIALALTGIAFSWGKGEEFISGVGAVLGKKFLIGKFQLRISGFVYAILIIILTYIFADFWQKIMHRKILRGSGLSEGAKSSITKISSYLVWGGGILMSLSALGLNSTSMALGFGALGIGLGFGLQNIFNNFISGLILLFERPIQVGDVIEIGGVWGEVQKINVRSTIVQTYTNSSLIIPNSEFISSQVTNWSHKDPFIRRDLNVNVAYGTDTKLVEEILLKATDKVTEVCLYPEKPKVQFINFGNSSIDFRLRFWSTIHDYINAESNLRHEIIELFTANNIEIPFPQTDIHIKRDSKDQISNEDTKSI